MSLLSGVPAEDVRDAPKFSVQGMVLPDGDARALEVGSRGRALGEKMEIETHATTRMS